MEWMLQVVDEIDDTVIALWQCSLCAAAEARPVLAIAAGAGTIGTALFLGADASLMAGSASLLSVASALQFHAGRS